jgi:hypothetical protein
MTTICPTDSLNGFAPRGITDYSATAKLLHWLAVLLMLVQFRLDA